VNRPEAERPDEAAGPARKPRSGVWTRHRGTILTVVLVLYTLALAIGVADDVFHLGLFPTQLERRARRLVEQLDAPDAATRRAAAGKLASEIDTYIAVPALLRALRSDSQQRRSLAIDTLRRITKAHHGYAPDAPAPERQAAAARWRRWWNDNKYRY